MAKKATAEQVSDRTETLTQARRAFQMGQFDVSRRLLSALLEQQPDDAEARALLEEVELRAAMESRRRVHARRHIIVWRRVWTYVGMLALVVVAGWAGQKIYHEQVVPQVAAAQQQREQATLFAEAESLYASGQYEAAMARLDALATLAPDYPGAADLLSRINDDASVEGQYARAVALQEKDALDEALAEFVEITVRRPGYRDVAARITDIKRVQQRNALYAEAVRLEQEGDAEEALNAYRQLQAIDASYRTDEIREKVFALDVTLGKAVMEQGPTNPEQLPAALTYFEDALTIHPRDTTASELRDVVSAYLKGQSLYADGSWAEAARLLGSVYDRRPSFMTSQVTSMLYTSYVNLGDEYQANGDLAMAYASYVKANGLPIEDRALVSRRIMDIVPALTPTATPAPTATPKPTRVVSSKGAGVASTPQPLASYHNMIIFVSDNEDNPGYWMMAPDGSQRQFLGKSSALRKEYEALVEQQKLSPDGRYRLFVQSVNNIAQIFVQDPPTSQFPSPKPRQLTKAGGLCYDPAWSPDGSRILFVSQASGSDDIHVMNADGSGVRNLTENEWEWDKHPSWSPDSTRIVFWSNRQLRKQIYVMDDQGRNVTNISNSEYDEYDPVWVR